jgi:hypothetical protein
MAAPGTWILTIPADDGSAKFDLEISIDHILASPHIFDAPNVAMDEIDEQPIEVTIVDRRHQRQRRDEHREIGDEDRSNPGFAFAHVRMFRCRLARQSHQAQSSIVGNQSVVVAS